MHHETEIGSVEAMSSEGQGIVRHEGRVTFIPFTAIGDTVKYQIVHHKKNFATGSLLDIIHPSLDRAEPLCPYFGTCGGCQLQHVTYTTQLAYKRTWVDNALQKIGGISSIVVPPVVPASAEWKYRRRVSLLLLPEKNSYRAGYTATDNKTLLSVDTCPIFIEKNDPILSILKTIVSRLHAAGNDPAKATLLKCAEHRYLLHFHFKKMPGNCEEILKTSFEKHPCFQGIIATSPKTSLSFGDMTARTTIEGLDITYSPKSFIQNHPEQSANIYRQLEQHIASIHPKSVIDLYCGIGVTSLLASRHCRNVIGIELNKHAVSLARTNAKTNGRFNASFEADDVSQALPKLLQTQHPDLIIANPPREGLAPDVLAMLCAAKSPYLIYISCMPSTLARDLKTLYHHGYEVTSLIPFDMFPQTFHVETVTVLQHKG